MKTVLIVCFETYGIIHSADEWGGGAGSRFKLPRGPDCAAYVYVFLGTVITCRLNKLTASDRDQVTLQLDVSLSDLV